MTAIDHFPPCPTTGMASPEALAHLHHVTCEALTIQLTAALARPGRTGIRSELLSVARQFLEAQPCVSNRIVTEADRETLETIRTSYIEAVQAAMAEENPKLGVMCEARLLVRMLKDEMPVRKAGWSELPGACEPFITA